MELPLSVLLLLSLFLAQVSKVESRSNGPAGNGNPPISITEAILRSLEIIDKNGWSLEIRWGENILLV